MRAPSLLAMVFAATHFGDAFAATGEPFQWCSDVERAKYATRAQPDLEPVERPRITEPPVEAVVQLLLTLRTNGTVEAICVSESRPANLFEQATVDAVRRWRYAPADVAKLPNDRRLRVEIEFRLQ